MVDFSYAILDSFKVSGYKFILYYQLDHFALIVPMREECEPSESAYVIPIQDEQALEMASGVDQFYFYVLP